MPYPLRRKVHNVSQCQIVRFRSSNFKIPGTTTTTMQTRALRSVPQGQRELEGFEQGCKVIHPHPGCCTTGRPWTNTHGQTHKSHLSHHIHQSHLSFYLITSHHIFLIILIGSHHSYSHYRLTLFLIYLESIPLHFLIGLNSYLLAHRSHLPHLSYISFSASISSIPSFSHLSHLSHHIFLIFFSPESHCPHLSYLLIYLIPIDLNPRPRPHSSYTSFFQISHRMTHMTCIS